MKENVSVKKNTKKNRKVVFFLKLNPRPPGVFLYGLCSCFFLLEGILNSGVEVEGVVCGLV